MLYSQRANTVVPDNQAAKVQCACVILTLDRYPRSQDTVACVSSCSFIIDSLVVPTAWDRSEGLVFGKTHFVHNFATHFTVLKYPPALRIAPRGRMGGGGGGDWAAKFEI